ncbi:MAG: YraN family protein [Alphaproteobacteria bacterium]|nr:YraN family protein [Alphaproteobacteria bacterium]
MNRQLRGLLSYVTGHDAERQACDYLKKKGYRFVEKNVHTQHGIGANELDLIMTDKKTLVFVEVKKRIKLSDAAEAVNTRVQKRLYRAAQIFIAKHPEYQNNDCRFDVVLITPDQEPVHLKNVIEER